MSSFENITLILQSVRDPLADYGDVNGDGKNEFVMMKHLKTCIMNNQLTKVIQDISIKPSLATEKRMKTEEYKIKIGEYESGDIPIILKLIDIDGDNKKEMLIARADKIIYLVDERGKELFCTELDSSIKDVIVCDINQDGIDECALLTLDGLLLLLYRHKKKIRIKTLIDDYMIESFIITDINGNGIPEFLVLTEYGTFDIYTLEKKMNLRLLDKKPLDSVLYNPILCSGDIDGDNQPEIIMGDESGRVITYKNGKFTTLFDDLQEIISLHLCDINNDKKDEAIVTNYEGTIRIFNLSANKKNILLEKSEEERISQDLDGDGFPEEISKYWKEISLIRKNKVIWRKELDGWISTASVADINNDGISEILICTTRGEILLYDISGNIIWNNKLTPMIMASAISDFDNDSHKEILLTGMKSMYLFKVFTS